MGLLRIIHLFVESKHLKFSHRSSKGTLSKPSNLMRRGLSGVIGNIIKQKTNEVVTLLSATNNFRTNVSGIVVGGCLSCLADIFHRSHLHAWAFVVPCVVAAISSFSSKSSICLGVVCCALHGCRHLDSFVNFFAHFVECADVFHRSRLYAWPFVMPCMVVSHNILSLSLTLSLSRCACLTDLFSFALDINNNAIDYDYTRSSSVC